MLSATGGYTRWSRVLGSRRDVATLRTTLCPALRMGGSCRAFVQEEKIRAKLAAEKEEELLRTATEVYNLQVEVLQQDDVAVVGDEERTALITRIVDELKAESAYVNWSLDTAVAELMASRRLRRCSYSHQLGVHMALHGQRRRDDAEVGAPPKRKGSGGVKGMGAMRHTSEAEERRRVFATLTPLQKCVVCLLWQGSFEVPKKVVCDVRSHMQAEALDDEELSDANVEVEEQRVVTLTSHRPSLGVVELSSLPHIVAYLSQHPDASVIHAETAAHFAGSGAHTNTEKHDENSGAIIPRGITEKQIDLSTPTCVHQMVEAIVWTMRIMNNEEKLYGPQRQRVSVVLRSLTLRRCAITNADALINALRKHNLDTTLLALDISDNRLMNLRFLFTLRLHFAERLLRLSLSNNPITRKPEYREQVRKSLPRLTSLDGTAIRRPPLSLPHPTELSCTFRATMPEVGSRQTLRFGELDAVMDGLARFLYIWETRRIPSTPLEEEEEEEDVGRKSKRQRQSIKRPKVGTQKVLSMPEEELDDDNFHHRYLHPSATFSMSVHEGLKFFNPETMRLATDVEHDHSYVGMRLSPLDMRDLQLFDVSIKGNSRNLLLGRSVLHRFARGSLDCYKAYKCSVYPPRLEVCHHLGGALMSVAKITDTALSRPASQQQREEVQKLPQKRHRRGVGCPPSAAEATTTSMPFSGDINTRKPIFYIVTMHGVMSWRAPSMRQSECMVAAFDRVMTFVENTLPETNILEKRRSASLLVFSDELHLRPSTSTPQACFRAVTEERVVRLVVEYGLEACADGAQLVHAVVERSNSDAAASAALQTLVFGSESGVAESAELPPLTVSTAATAPDDDDDNDDYINAAAKDEDDETAHVKQYFDIISIISAHDAVSLGSDAAAAPAAVPHRVTLEQVESTVALMNSRCTMTFGSSQSNHD